MSVHARSRACDSTHGAVARVKEYGQRGASDGGASRPDRRRKHAGQLSKGQEERR
jgi:hypothetical protein